VEHLQQFLMTISVTAALAILLHTVFGVGDSVRPPASGAWQPPVVYVSAPH
jgi:hypothetical protein